ncbi:MAG: mechanosensitive ion channel family protein [Fimbriimonadaceae bacterium]|nr:mechanosensitive ion channel family protein [Fimbriimonadaceae bacterium]
MTGQRGRWALLLTLATSLAAAQFPATSSGRPAVPDTLASPRATLRTFFDGMNEGDVMAAVATLDLTGVPVIERPTKGPQLANKLLAILNRELYIDVQKVPNLPDSKPYTVPIHRRNGDLVGEVVVDKSPDGAFRFTPTTLSRLDEVWNQVKSKPVIRGLMDPGEQKFDPAKWFGDAMPAELHSDFLGVARWKWILLTIMLVMGAFLALVAKGLAQLLGRVILRLKKSDGRYREIQRAGSAVGVFLFASVFAGLTPYLGLPGGLSGATAFIALLAQYAAAVLFVGAVWDGALKVVVSRHAARNDGEVDIVVPVISRLGMAVIILVAGLTLLAQVGVNVTAFLATLGIGGVMLALAAKDSVENLFGSVMVLVERPFKIGDWVKVGDVEGVVEDIRLRSTRVRTFEDSLIVMPNSTLVTTSVENFGKRRKRRFRTVLRVEYGTPPGALDTFAARIRDILHAERATVAESDVSYLNDFGPTGLHIIIQCYLDVPTWTDELRTRSEIITQVLAAAEDLGVKFAAPSTTASV